ncbi:MAG: ShlB/FhaC/HecB family hemolysin secretion/activation protein [Planctomycetia bacterium]|nr:ShlB/FhaC/HecB family hemolysin secretion/activation protein [Planctomycetia bacterium]
MAYSDGTTLRVATMPYRLLRLIGVVSALVAPVAILNPLFAQDFQRYRPQTLPAPQYQPSIPEKPVEPAAGSDAVLVERWDAVLVLDRPEKVRPLDDFADLTGVHFDFEDSQSLVYRAEFKRIVETYLDGPLTLRRLNQLSRDIILYYRRNGQPVVDVVIPEQKITQGTVQLVVREARIGAVRVEGACWFNNCMLADQIECTRTGDRLIEGKLKSDLFWLNRNPFRNVEVDLEPGKQPGTTDVIYKVNDAAPWRAYLGYEDTGVPLLGIDRVYGGLIWGDAFKRDGQLSYQYTSDTQFDRLQAHSYSYQRAWSREWSFQTYGAYSDVTARPDPFLQTGQSWIVGGALLRYFNYDPYLQSWLSFGYDFKSTNNNLEFNELPVVGGRADLWELNFGYDRVQRFNDVEYLILTNDLFVGPNGGFSAYDDAAGFSSIRPNTRPGFVYNRSKAEAVTALPWNLQLLGRVTGQVASQRLLYSEMLGFGGYDSIRGYDQRVFNGDIGYFTNLELGPQPWIIGTTRDRKVLRAFTFLDYGGGYVRNPVPGEVASQVLASTGAGARFSCSDRLTLRFDYGWGLSNVVGATTNQRAHLGVVYLMGPRPRR